MSRMRTRSNLREHVLLPENTFYYMRTHCSKRRTVLLRADETQDLVVIPTLRFGMVLFRAHLSTVYLAYPTGANENFGIIRCRTMTE
jgi:hypothetical protein